MAAIQVHASIALASNSLTPPFLESHCKDCLVHQQVVLFFASFLGCFTLWQVASWQGSKLQYSKYMLHYCIAIIFTRVHEHGN